MTDATILLGPDGRPSGSAFVWSPGVVITANHVLKGKPADRVQVQVGDDVRAVTAVESDPSLDVAVLAASGAVPPLLSAAAAVDDRWVVTSRPASNDPQLDGRVTATGRIIVNDGGAEMAMLQLDVEQPLGDYGGYSGSAVRAHARARTVLGVLCEQVHQRNRPAGGGRPAASTVLYAVPIGEVVRRFGLVVVDDVAYRNLAAAGRSLRDGDPDGADRSLAGIPSTARDAEYWLLRARAARLRRNALVEAEYLDRALRCDARHPPSIAAKITQLVLTNESGDRAAAQRLAEGAHGVSPALDNWTDCLRRHRMLEPGIRSRSEVVSLCPFPDPDWS
jgi:hypothetical protein